MIFGYEWQTISLFSGLLVLVCVLFWKWSRSDDPTYRNFKLLHSVADRDGHYNADKVHMTGAFVVTTFAVVVSVIRNAVTLDVAALVGGYASVWALKQAWTYTVSRRTETDVRREEIRRGYDRVDMNVDDPREGVTVEEEEQSQRSTPRRRKSDSVFK